MSDFKIVKLLDPISLTLSGPSFTGAYNNGTSYSIGQAVSYNGSSYVAIAATTGNIPTNTTYWQLIASKGDTGTTGAQGDPGEGVPVGGTTGQALVKNSNTDYDTGWVDFSSTPPGSDTQVVFNDGGSFGADSSLTYNKTSNALGVQVAAIHPLHVVSETGTTLADITTASVSLVDETIDPSPTGSITAIAEFPVPSGNSCSPNYSGSGYSASGQAIDYRIYGVYLSGSGTYYYSQNYESLSFTDTLVDSSPFSMTINFGSTMADQTHWFIEAQVNGGGYSAKSLAPIALTSYDDDNSGSISYPTQWPSFYRYTATVPVSPTGGVTGSWNTSYTGFTADGKTFEYEVKSYSVLPGGVKYSDDTNSPDTGSFIDPNDASQGAPDVSWSSGVADGYIVRFSIDSGSTWSYFDSLTSTSYVWDNTASDTDAETVWNRGFSTFAGVSYEFKCFGKTNPPSLGGQVYAETAISYTGTALLPNTSYIFLHAFSGMTSGGGKILADYLTSVSNGKNISGNFTDAGYNSWFDGVTITPNHYGFTGTDQNREYKFYGYSSSLLIYSSTAYVDSTSDSGGYKSITGTLSYPSGVTSIKVTRSINGGGHTSAKIFVSPEGTFTDDVFSSWPQTTTVTPTSAIPSASRFDLPRSAIGENKDNIIVNDITGSGTRYPSIAFTVSANKNSASSLVSRIAVNSATGRILLGGGVEGYSGPTMGTQTYILGSSYDFNLNKSNSNHLTYWAQDNSNPLAYFFSAGDSNRGTAYFGQSSLSFGTDSKVCIAPTSGSTVGLNFRRTSGFTGDNIRIDEAGSYRGGWGQGGRMYINAASLSTSTFILIGGTSSGSQIRLGASTGNGTTEGDIWNDTTQKSLVRFGNGIKQFSIDSLFTQTATGTCANTTTETTISNTGI